MSCAVIILAATLGKFGGTFASARFAGMPRGMAAALGVLMNTRGLMELIVLNIGLELGVISPKLFAMMVIMALVTTIATTPILAMLEAAPTKFATTRRTRGGGLGRGYGEISQKTVLPPLTLMVWPVMNAASSLAKNATAAATSAGTPQRPAGTWAT